MFAGDRRADEAMVAHTGGTNLTVNLRRDVTECEVCPPKVSLDVIKWGNGYYVDDNVIRLEPAIVEAEPSQMTMD